jgi:two-component sensor histidine kinase
VKNLFSVSSSVVALSAKNVDTADELASTVTARLRALARAHALTLPSPHGSGEGEGLASLQALLAALLSPYEGDTAQGRPRVTTRGSDLPISSNAMTGFALVVHEFVTNAAKYGALSTDTGYVDLECRDCGDMLELVWVERGGPAVTPAGKEGFGTRLARTTIEGQFGGDIVRQWHPEGLVIRLNVPKQILQ